MHIIHTRWTGGHTRKTRQAPVDMLHCFVVRYPLVFQHIFYQVNAAAWAVQLIPQKLIGGASRCAKTAVDAAAQNIIGMPYLWIFKLGFCKMCLHQLIRPRFRMPRGSNLPRRVCVTISIARLRGWKWKMFCSRKIPDFIKVA